MGRTWDLGDSVWFPVTSVKPAGLWVRVPHLRNELHFPVSEGHCGGNVLVMAKRQVVVLPAAWVLLSPQGKLTYSLMMRHGTFPWQGVKQGIAWLQWGCVSKRAQVQWIGSHPKKTPGCFCFPSCPLSPHLSCSAGPAGPYQAKIPRLREEAGFTWGLAHGHREPCLYVVEHKSKEGVLQLCECVGLCEKGKDTVAEETTYWHRV